MKHSPAPWTPVFKDLNKLLILDANGEEIATLHFHYNLLKDNFNEKSETMFNDARLFLAAPKMLEALKEVQIILGLDKEPDMDVARVLGGIVNGAIAEATRQITPGQPNSEARRLSLNDEGGEQ